MTNDEFIADVRTLVAAIEGVSHDAYDEYGGLRTGETIDDAVRWALYPEEHFHAYQRVKRHLESLPIVMLQDVSA